MARLRVLARRGAVERPAVLEAGSLRLDPGSRAVARGEVTIDVTAREFAVLEYLLRHRDLVVSKRDILGGVWDEDFDGDPNIVEVYIAHLRQKIDRPFGKATIQTVRGAGYRLVSDG